MTYKKVASGAVPVLTTCTTAASTSRLGHCPVVRSNAGTRNTCSEREKLKIQLAPLVFHVNALLVAICFLRLAVKWPQLMLKWQRVERQLPPHQMWRDREALALRVHKVTFVLITLALTEHLLSVVSGIHFAIHCSPNSDPIKSFFIAVSPHTFLIFNYSTWLAWCGKLLNVLNTFGWSYMDVFLMIIGLGLSSLFGQVQNSLNRVKGKVVKGFWLTRKESN
ncbi:unnamed protein product [Ceratitis capitata]|uniref:(Mediterranean fruit fly) hypothetical protein n=1 Tax=Ceratitis capitata TaxID=7213 RepID=A0A811UY67_CERCA|nr:unnamed protein product [Ceratitis capitata]